MLGSNRNIIFLVLLQLLLGLNYLEKTPRIYIDEVWDSSLGYSLANTGSLKHPSIECFGGSDIHYIPPRVVLPLVCAVIFKVAGYSIATSRVGSVLFGTLAVVSFYAVVRRWFGEKQGGFISLALIINPWFFEISRCSRPEIYCTALALVFLWLIVNFFDSGSCRTAFFAGVFAGLSGLAHPNGMILVFSIGCVLITWQRGKMLSRLILWAIMGFTITILPYVIYVIKAVQDPRVSFSEQMLINVLHKSLIQNEITRWKIFLQWPEGIPLAIVILTSWIAAWYRSTAADKALAAIIALFVLILPFASVNWIGRYLAVIIPFLSALIVRLIWRVTEDRGIILRNWYKLRYVISGGIVLVYLSTCLMFIGLMFYCLRGADFTRVINRIASVVGRDSHVYGNPIFWVGHDKYRYGPYPVTFENVSLPKAINIVRKHRFDYAIRTAWFGAPPVGFARPPITMPDFRDYCLDDWVCRMFGTKIDEFYDPYYGPIEIYKLNWDKSSLKR